MKRQEGECGWHLDDLFEAQEKVLVSLEGDLDTRGIHPAPRLSAQKMTDLEDAQQVLREAVVSPEGYRTFSTCHVRLPPQPNPNSLQPATTGALEGLGWHQRARGSASKQRRCCSREAVSSPGA